MPSASSDLSMRLSRASKACMRTSGTMRATSRAGSPSTWSILGKRVGEIGRRLADHRHRNVAEAGVLREQGEEGLDHARRKAVADHDAVDVARGEMLGGGLHAERAQHLDALADGDAERGIERAAAGDQHGRVVERVADRQRRQLAAMRARRSRSGAARWRAARARAWPIAGARSAARPAARHRPAARPGWRHPARPARARWSARSGRLAVAICRQSMRAEDSIFGAPGSAITTAAGLTATKAVGASAHLASTMGKAPAAPSASTRSVAGLSATTMIGPCSDMGYARDRYKQAQTLTGGLLIAASTNDGRSGGIGLPGARKASGNQRIDAARSAMRHAPLTGPARAPARRWPSSRAAPP